MPYLPKKLQPYRSLIQNFTSLSFLQIANYIFPLIVLPYVVRVIGPSKYGLINFAAAFVAYFNLICEYGFGLSGTKEVSINREDKAKLDKVFSNIITTKVLLFILCFIILLILVSVVEILYAHGIVILLSYGIVFGYTLFPGWFFQGIEQMKYITIIQLIVRTIITILIFILIKEEADFIKLVLLNAIAQVSIGVLGLVVVIYKFKVRYYIPPVNQITNQLKLGWNIFQSMIAINICTSSNTFVLGLFADQTIVGYYSAADKIRIAFQGVQSVLSQTVFPFGNRLAKKSYNEFVMFIKRLLKIEAVMGLTVSFTLFVFASQITTILLGEKFLLSCELLKIISLIPFFSSLSNVFGLQIMLPLGFERAFNSLFSSVAVLHICLLMILVPTYLAHGTSIAASTTELLAVFLTLWFVLKRKIFIDKE